MTDAPRSKTLVEKLDDIQEGLLRTEEAGVAVAADTALVTHFYKRTVKQLKGIAGIILVAGLFLGYGQYRVERVAKDARVAAQGAKDQSRANQVKIALLKEDIEQSKKILAEFRRYQPGGDLYAEGQKSQAAAINQLIQNDVRLADEIKAEIRASR